MLTNILEEPTASIFTYTLKVNWRQQVPPKPKWSHMGVHDAIIQDYNLEGYEVA